MKFLLYTLLLIFGITVFSVNEGYAQQQKKPKKKYQSLSKTRRKSTGYQRKKQNFKASQSRTASDFRSSEPPTAVDQSRQQSQTAKFKGNSETYGTPSVEKTQSALARFKSKLRIKQKRLSDPTPLSTFRGGEASLPPTNYAQREIDQQKMSKYRGETKIDLKNRKQQYEISAYKRSKFMGERALSRAYKKQQYEFSAYKRSIFLGEKILSRKSKIQQYELSAYKREKFMGEKVLSPAYRRQQYELSAYKREKFLGERVLSAKYKKQMQEISAFKRSQFMGERIRINRPDNPYPTFVYQKSRMKRSFAQKEKFRKRMLKRINRNKIKQIPPAMRIPRKLDKNTVPAYDVNESEIWAKSRELDGSEARTEASKPKGLKGLFRKKQKPKEETTPVSEEPTPEK
ncbi:MAG: hypothetical protein H7Y04_08690 [Verrucomicrobia bacterium]|nr:hypothetical protein [Cytophagales bacterium]